MANRKKTDGYTAKLPVCRVTPAMREAAEDVAKRKDVTICEVQRRAMSLFLAIASENSEYNIEKSEGGAQ